MDTKGTGALVVMLIECRKWALWRLPVGVLFFTAGLVTFLFVFGPLFGIEMPKVLDLGSSGRREENSSPSTGRAGGEPPSRAPS